MWEKGYVQVYTGNGKGKTTAAIGLALRAAAANKRIFIGQFIKGMHYSELEILPKIKGIELKQYGRDCFIINKPTENDIKIAQEGLKDIGEKTLSGNYDLVIYDEANVAIYFGLFSFDDLWTYIENRPPHVEVVITGRYAPSKLIEKADLVTEMKEIKHYYTKGVQARVGIEK